MVTPIDEDSLWGRLEPPQRCRLAPPGLHRLAGQGQAEGGQQGDCDADGDDGPQHQGLRRSVPAVRAWIVVVMNSGKLT